MNHKWVFVCSLVLANTLQALGSEHAIERFVDAVWECRDIPMEIEVLRTSFHPAVDATKVRESLTKSYDRRNSVGPSSSFIDEELVEKLVNSEVERLQALEGKPYVLRQRHFVGRSGFRGPTQRRVDQVEIGHEVQDPSNIPYESSYILSGRETDGVYENLQLDHKQKVLTKYLNQAGPRWNVGDLLHVMSMGELPLFLSPFIAQAIDGKRSFEASQLDPVRVQQICDDTHDFLQIKATLQIRLENNVEVDRFDVYVSGLGLKRHRYSVYCDTSNYKLVHKIETFDLITQDLVLVQSRYDFDKDGIPALVIESSPEKGQVEYRVIDVISYGQPVDPGVFSDALPDGWGTITCTPTKSVVVTADGRKFEYDASGRPKDSPLANQNGRCGQIGVVGMLLMIVPIAVATKRRHN